MLKDLNSEKALIFRITHRDNVPWVLDNGLYCRNSDTVDPQFVEIGNLDLIDKRHHREVEIDPCGTLSDYIPFYFTPYSPMLYNIKTGWGGVHQRNNDEIVILVSSLYKLYEGGVTYLFTDRHAYLTAAQFYSDLDNLDKIDWQILQNRDFSKDSNDPEKMERYMAEALVYKHMPISALLGMFCYDISAKDDLSRMANDRNIELGIHVDPKWYF